VKADCNFKKWQYSKRHIEDNTAATKRIYIT